jgi:hypothetical protein
MDKLLFMFKTYFWFLLQGTFSGCTHHLKILPTPPHGGMRFPCSWQFPAQSSCLSWPFQGLGDFSPLRFRSCLHDISLPVWILWELINAVCELSWSKQLVKHISEYVCGHCSRRD